jgi:hypothetical protein
MALEANVQERLKNAIEALQGRIEELPDSAKAAAQGLINEGQAALGSDNIQAIGAVLPRFDHFQGMSTGSVGSFEEEDVGGISRASGTTPPPQQESIALRERVPQVDDEELEPEEEEELEEPIEEEEPQEEEETPLVPMPETQPEEAEEPYTPEEEESPFQPEEEEEPAEEEVEEPVVEEEEEEPAGQGAGDRFYRLWKTPSNAPGRRDGSNPRRRVENYLTFPRAPEDEEAIKQLPQLKRLMDGIASGDVLPASNAVVKIQTPNESVVANTEISDELGGREGGDPNRMDWSRIAEVRFNYNGQQYRYEITGSSPQGGNLNQDMFENRVSDLELKDINETMIRRFKQ